MARGRKLLLATLVLATGGGSAFVFLKPDAGQNLAGLFGSTPQTPASEEAATAPSSEAPPAASPPAKATVVETPPIKAEPAKKIEPVAKPEPAKAPPTAAADVHPLASAGLSPPPWAAGSFPAKPVFGSPPSEGKTTIVVRVNPDAKVEAKSDGKPDVKTEPRPGEVALKGDLFNRLNGGPATARVEPPVAGNATGYPGNRIDATPVANGTTPQGEPEILMHTVRDGDTLRRLAERYLGDQNRYLEIFDANRQLLKNPEVLPIGSRLSIALRPASSVPPRDPIRAVEEATSTSLPPVTAGIDPPRGGLKTLRPLRPLVPLPPDAFKRPQ